MSLLKTLVLNGASRHRLRKGFFLRNATGPEKAWNCTRLVLETGSRSLRAHQELQHFRLDGSEKHPGVVTLVTPWMPVYTFQHREEFCRRVAKAARLLSEAAKPNHRILGVGLEPFAASDEGKEPELCADVHQIEVMDEGEIERIYNLFRQYLPELIAITVNSALRKGKIQRDFSQRMRFNASSFLPRYLSQFSTSRLDQLRRMMRKDHGLSDLRQMDVNPLGDRIDLLDVENRDMLGDSTPALELRFSDAQCSIPFTRALIILFQAIAIQGRAMARQGRRVYPLRDPALDGNKARAIQRGMTAVFQHDPKYPGLKDGQRWLWYHNRHVSERASSALLNLLECPLLSSLHNLECRWPELAPLVLGLELRRRNRQSLANYAEYQQFLAYTEPRNLTSALLEQWEMLLVNPSRDLVVEKNSATHPALAAEIEAEWLKKLTPLSRRKGNVIWYNQEKGCGKIQSEDETFFVTARDLEGRDRLIPRQIVTFNALPCESQASEVRVEQKLRREGRISAFRPDRNFGFIMADQDQGKYFFHGSSLAPGVRVSGKERVSFELSRQSDGRWAAINVQVIVESGSRRDEANGDLPASRIRGKVTSLAADQQTGTIETRNGNQLSFALGDGVRAAGLHLGQRVVCAVHKSPEGLRAIDVEIETMEDNLGD